LFPCFALSLQSLEVRLELFIGLPLLSHVLFGDCAGLLFLYFPFLLSRRWAWCVICLPVKALGQKAFLTRNERVRFGLSVFGGFDGDEQTDW
jgi:hypothetical protein